MEMKTIILCGGRGLRLNELTIDTPKSLLLINNKPVLWHICNHFKSYGYNDFIFCLGYKGEMIKNYFKDNEFNIMFLDTGMNTTKNEKLKQCQDLIDGDNFFVSYGDDLCNVDLNELFKQHKKTNAIATLTSIDMKSDFGILRIEKDRVKNFNEKPNLPYLINGGYYVFNKKIFNKLDNAELEDETLKNLAFRGLLYHYKHIGYFHPINTFKDLIEVRNEFGK